MLGAMDMRPFDETRAALIGREGEVLAALGINAPRRGHIRCPIPSHDDRNPSWRFDFRTGRWHCTCGSGDIFDLVIAMGRAYVA
jgi:putative DNA primase/helicase